jgi:transcriptional regulator with XRE-family HTH domain
MAQLDAWKRDVDNRYSTWPVPEMELLGARFRNGRRQAGLSQRQVAWRAGVSQSLVSRVERGLATGTTAERLIRIAEAIGPSFPFGFCPHHQNCAYPYDPRRRSALPWLSDD